MASPAPTVPSSNLRRPKRSARPVMGSAPSDARRMMASPTPRSVPDSPAWSAMLVPWLTSPKPRATSPRAATTLNCPIPDAKAAMATPTTARSLRRSGCRPAGPGGGIAPGSVLNLVCLRKGARLFLHAVVSRLCVARRFHAAPIWLAGGPRTLGIRACRHGYRHRLRCLVPVGRVAGRAPSPRPALAVVADRAVPGRSGSRGAGHGERHRRLRRRPVLGPHDPAPHADHDRTAAAGAGPAGHAAAAREPEPAAHLGQAGGAVPGGHLPDLAPVRPGPVRGDDRRHAPDRPDEPGHDQPRPA